MTTIELAGLEVFGYHSANDDERRDGQRLHVLAHVVRAQDRRAAVVGRHRRADRRV